ncbi:MAG: FAD-binding domain-containing protein [Bryobacteraceae bacterium]
MWRTATTEPARRASGNSAGANSHTFCCITTPNHRTRRSGRNLLPSPGGCTRNTSRRGSAARPATHWWTPGCGSCGTPAGCRTGCGWSAASFLVKHLVIDWQAGAAWFWDTPVDADLANNSLGWQWVAGCGADAAPYFRIFNPAIQAGKFDPGGGYIRRWVPESQSPIPIVDHREARERALAALERIRR